MFYPDFITVGKLAKDYDLIPVAMEMNADMETPISVFKRLKDGRFGFLLESVEGGEKWARYSFIGRNPFLIFKSRGRNIYIEEATGSYKELEGNPLDVLKKIMDNYRSLHISGLPRFNGGAAGFIGYDMVRQYENLPGVPIDELELPESHFMFCGEILAFDHLKQKIHIIVNMSTEGNLESNYCKTAERIKAIYDEITDPERKAAAASYSGKAGNMKINGKTGDMKNSGDTAVDKKTRLSIKSNTTRESFCEKVVRAKEYIRNGDIFQVVLSQRLSVEIEEDPFDVYRVLRTINPSPYMYYLDFGDYKIVGSSPEMLVRVENGIAETCPIAGTRKRGATDEEDILLEKELLSDEKELAEHMMLVDLGRNDIGKVCKFGTVAVKDLMHVERYSHVMHIVTNVTGELKEDKTAFDALISLLPAGTLSGAPKVRAMEIIDELETVKRGTYGGAIGYLSFNGNLDSCITIRTMVFKGKTAYIQAGAGIVSDSVPGTEYEETLNKAGALIKSLEKAGEML